MCGKNNRPTRADKLRPTIRGWIVLCLWLGAPLLALAQETESSAEQVVITGPEVRLTGTTSVEPGTLGPTGDPRKIDIVAPNVSIGDAGADSFEDVYSIRGLNNTPNFSKQALTVYVDDVPSVSTFTNFTELGAIQSVDLARSIQGDRVGKNSEAGLLDIRTIIPDDTVRAIGSAAGGSYGLWQENALLSGPILTDMLFAKVEAGYVSRDGYLDNVFRDTRPDYQQHAFSRIQLRLAPSGEWDITFTAEYHYIRDGVQRFVLLSSPDPFRVKFDFDGKTDIDSHLEALRIVRTFDSARLTLITSWRAWMLEPYTADFDYSRAPIVTGRFDLRQTQLAEEIRLESVDPAQDWRWRIGIFADRVTNGGQEIFAAPPFIKTINFHEREVEVATFGQLTRHFQNGFEMTLGMRIDYDMDEITRRRVQSFSPATEFSSDITEWNVQPKLTLAYQCSSDTRIYASSGYGYRNGGFSFLETRPRLASFDRERVWATEVGVQGDYFDHRLQLRGAAFVNRIENYQVERLAMPPDITVVNAPLVVSYGGELELTAKPFTNFTVRGALGYIHSAFVDFHDPFTGADLSGNRTPFTPEFTAALQTRYAVRGVFVEGELLASGETFYDEANTASIRQAPHAEVNARLGYEASHFRVYIYGDNLNDARYFTQKIAYAGIGTPAPPRTIGVAITIKL